MTKGLLACALLAALTPGLYAAEDVTTAAGFSNPSIQDGAGARAIALGSTYVGIAEGSDSLLWNPAGLGTLTDPELAEHHNAGLVGSSQDIAVIGLPLGLGGGLGLSLGYENDGSFDGRDASGDSTGTYSADAYGGSVGWGIGVPGGLYLGVAAKFDQENLAGMDLNSTAVDLGALWDIAPYLSLGAAYNNLGPAVSGWQLDQGLDVGLSSHFYDADESDALAAISGQTLSDGETSIHFGLEDTLYKLLSLRAGYSFSASDADADTSNLLGWTFGLGLSICKLQVDYAYVPLSDLGATQRISVTYTFGYTCLDAPVGAFMEDETLIVLDDVDFGAPAAGNGGEELTDAAQTQLYQALTGMAGAHGVALKVSGESAALVQSGGRVDGERALALGRSRSKLVRDYILLKMPQARLTSRLVQGTENDSAASLFEVVVR